MIDRRFLSFLAACVIPAAGLAATGGPDKFGYTWADSNELGVTIDIPPYVTGPFDLGLTKDTVSAAQNFGFNFPYYGANYTQFKVSSNGWITLDTAITNSYPTPQPIPLVAAPNRLLAFYWRDLTAPDRAWWGTVANGVVVQLWTNVPGSNPVSMSVVLYNTGVIQYVYSSVDQQNTISTGIENAAGDDGLNPWYLGTGQNGYSVQDSTAIVFFPPPKLSCAGAPAIACGQKLTFSSPASVNPNVTGYRCSPDTYAGREKVIQFTNPGLSDVTIALSNLTAGVDMDVMLLRQGQCNEFQCLDYSNSTDTPPRTISRTFLGKGTYDIVVDGKKATDNGSFDLQVTCTPKSSVLNCQKPGDPPVRGATTGSSFWNTYGCTNQFMDGPEYIYEIPFTAPGNIKATFTPDPGISLDLLAFDSRFDNVPNGCLQWADNSMTLFNPPSGTYYLVVDGRSGAPSTNDPNAGGYSLGVTCDVLLNCTSPKGDLTCFQDTNGTTVGAVNRAEQYSCSQDVFTGPEVMYRFHNDTKRTMSFLYSGPPELSIFLVPQSSCNEGACFDYGNGRLVTRDLPVGDYYVVIDGKAGASGAFTITPICDNKVDPASGTWTLDPGKTVHETKLATVNADITRGDIVFAMDMTGSMGRNTPQLKTTAKQVIAELSKVIDDVQFGLVSHEDYPNSYTSCGYSGGYGGGADRPYRLNLPITSNLASLDAAIDALQQGGGGDLPEGYLRVLYEMYADATNIGWRASSRRIAMLFGDDEPHSCDAFACTRARDTPGSTGVDPGRDGIAGTADDLDLFTVMQELKAQGITPIEMFAGNAGKPNLLQDWQCWTGWGGGLAYDAPGASAPPNIITDVRKLIEQKSLRCDKLLVRTSKGFEAWITNVSPTSVSVGLPARVNFDFDIGPPPGTPPGVYSFTVEVVCDGIVKASQAVTITVPGTVCTPNPQNSVSGNLCAGNPQTIDASTSSILGCGAPAFLQYQFKDAANTVVQPWSTTAMLTVTPPVTTTYTLEIRCSDNTKCPLVGSKAVTVTVNPNPPADAGPPQSVCLNNSTTLGTPGVPPLQYSWAPSTELSNAFVAQPTFTASPPTGTRNYTLTVTDPVSRCTSTSTVKVDVVNLAPVGKIGNALRATKKTADVVLDWRSGPLVPKSYNVHRYGQKLQLPRPPAPPGLPAIGNTAVEGYTDLAAVPAPSMFFYDVYGRDCAGISDPNTY